MTKVVWGTGGVFVMVVALLVLAPTAANAQGENIGASSVTGLTPDPIVVGTQTLCFTVNVISPDLEYMDSFNVDLPDNWTLNSLAANSVPPANGCPAALPPVPSIGAGNQAGWASTGFPPQTGCGAWNGGAAGTDFVFCADVTVPDNTGAPWSFQWTIIGDGWGVEPHSATGVYGPVVPVEIMSFSVE